MKELQDLRDGLKKIVSFTLPKANSSPTKMDGLKTIRFLLGPGPFSGAFAVSFRECKFPRKGSFQLNGSTVPLHVPAMEIPVMSY